MVPLYIHWLLLFRSPHFPTRQTIFVTAQHANADPSQPSRITPQHFVIRHYYYTLLHSPALLDPILLSSAPWPQRRRWSDRRRPWSAAPKWRRFPSSCRVSAKNSNKQSCAVGRSGGRSRPVPSANGCAPRTLPHWHAVHWRAFPPPPPAGG